MRKRLEKILPFLLIIAFKASVAQINERQISIFFKELENTPTLRIKKINEQPLKWEDDDIYGSKDSINSFGYVGILKNQSVKSYFSFNDLLFIEQQFKGVQNEKWKKEHMGKYILLDSTEVDKIRIYSMRGRKMRNNYCYAFSIPLFSQDGKTAIIKQEFYCGFMCSSQCVYIYRKNENTWVEVFKDFCWST